MRQEEPIMLSEQELSEFTKISIPCLKHWRSIGYGPPFVKYKGRVVRYEYGGVLGWVESCLVEPGDDSEPGMKLVDGIYEIVVYGSR